MINITSRTPALLALLHGGCVSAGSARANAN